MYRVIVQQKIFIRVAVQTFVIMANSIIQYLQTQYNQSYYCNISIMSVVSKFFESLSMGARLTMGCENTTNLHPSNIQQFYIHNVVTQFDRSHPCSR